jgi:hypothetical protein
MVVHMLLIWTIKHDPSLLRTKLLSMYRKLLSSLTFYVLGKIILEVIYLIYLYLYQFRYLSFSIQTYGLCVHMHARTHVRAHSHTYLLLSNFNLIKTLLGDYSHTFLTTTFEFQSNSIDCEIDTYDLITIFV